MKRFPLLLAGVLGLALLAPATAQALPKPDAGGPAALLRYVGDAASATGNALSNGRCDVNGDESDDQVLGAWFWDKAPTNNIGAVYVLLGGESVKGGSLGDLSAAGAVRIDGPTDDPRSIGFSVACLGDVNGDGYDDLGIGDYQHNQVYVVFGRKSFTGLSLDSLGDRGFVVKQDYDPTSSATISATRENLGYGLSAVGDVNGDGKDDFAVSGIVADTQGRTNNGRIWVLSGRDDIADLNLDAPPAGSVLFTVDGAVSEERLSVVSAAGDVNGDGKDDLVLGSYTSTPWGSSVAVPGAAYVVFGGSTGDIDAASLGSKGFSIYGPKRQRDRLGISVSAAGDIDGDGKDDLVLGADGVNNATTGPRTGGAAVVLGSASTDTVYTDPLAANGQAVFTCPADETPGACATPTRRGYWISGEVNQDSAGYSVAGLGDVNDDGIPDLAIGAYGFDPVNPENTAATMSGAGAVYVVYGRTTGATQSLVGLAEADGYRIDGLKAGDRYGRQVASIGDFDGNGVRDLAAAGDFASRTAATGAQNGEVLVALMGRLDDAITLAGPASVTPGSDAVFTATVTTKAAGIGTLAEGTVSFTRGGEAVEGCSEVPVSGGTASCTITDDEEAAAADVVATYDGGTRLKQAESSAVSFAVVKTATTTTLTPSTLEPRSGQVVQLTADVATAADGESVDDGTVEFTSGGETIAACGSVAVSDGIAQCTTSWPKRSTPEVEARFSGTTVLAASVSGATTLSVGSASLLKPDAAPSLTYGTTPSPLTGEVRGYDGTPTGTVELRQGDTVLATATLDHGEYTLHLGKTDLAPGSHTLTVAYLGDDATRPDERSVAVTVARASASAKATASPATVTVKKQSIVLTVKVRSTVAATGTVQVTLPGRPTRSVKLVDGVAKTTFSPLTKKGTKTVSVSYAGSTTVGEAKTTVKVTAR